MKANIIIGIAIAVLLVIGIVYMSFSGTSIDPRTNSTLVESATPTSLESDQDVFNEVDRSLEGVE